MPQRKSAATNHRQRDRRNRAAGSAAQAPPQQQTQTQPGISPGHVKNLENMVRAIPLEGDALAQFLARHDAKAIDTSLTMAQFNAMKAELRKF
jgi:hemolysin activation/secretion protein